MKVLLFGTGDYYNRYKIWFEQEEVLGLIDNSASKQGTIIDGHPVYSPTEALKLDYDAIFVLSFYIKEMKKQLVDLGAPAEKIYHFFDIHSIFYRDSIKKEIHWYGKRPEKKQVAMLNMDLLLGGPALALFHAAMVFKNHGYEVTYASPLDGPLRQTLEENGITVIVDPNLMVQTMSECQWVQDYSLIICNAINYHVFLSERDESIPTIWWLHDAMFFYEGANREALAKISTNNLKVWAVGPVAEKAILIYRPDFKVSDLIYGVEDIVEHVENKEDNSGKVNFVTIGYVENRKGQDILIEAIKKLPAEICEKASFKIVGNNTSLMAKNLMDECQNVPEIEFLGLVDRKRVNEILDESDVLICPSREDPMPTVCAEAMMHGLPCIVSDSAGTVKYIHDGVDGIIFASEDIENLEKKIIWAIDNKDKVMEMEKASRRLYETTFSMKVFEENILGLIKQ